MNPTSPRDRRFTGPAQQIGAPGFLWCLVGVMTVIELILSLSAFGVFGG